MVKYSFDEVVLDPAEYFDLPDNLLHYPGFDVMQKHKLLRAWELDVTLLQVCDEENMTTSEDSRLLSRIHQALQEVDALRS